MTKILIEHGSSHNLGDTAMLEGVVSHYIEISDDAHLYVRDTPALHTVLWEWKNVSPVKLEVSNPIRYFPLLHYIPYLRRFEWPLRPLWISFCHAMLGRILEARYIPIKDHSDHHITLGKWCEPFDCLHIVGGSHLTDTFPNNFWQRSCLIQTFARQGKPVLLTGQQVGPFYSRWTEHSVERTLRKVDFIGLREPTDSVRFCEQAGLPSERFAIMGDDSFGLAPAPSQRVEQLLSRFHVSPGRFLAVNMRIGTYAATHEQHLNLIANFIALLSEHCQIPVLYVPIAMNAADSDIASGYKLSSVYPGDRLHVLDEPTLTPALAKGILARAYGAIGVSYHFCTFALSQGVPAICLFDGPYYGQKAKGLSAFWSDERLALPMKNVNSSDAIEKAQGLIGDEEFRQGLRRTGAEAVQRWKTLFDQKAFSIVFGQNYSAKLSKTYFGNMRKGKV